MLTVGILRTRLRDLIAEQDINLFGIEINSLLNLKEAHYARNSFQPEHVSYIKLLEARTSDGWQYELMGKAESAFHQLNRNGEFYNENNAKWVSTDGSQEFVYKYAGSDINGQFAMLTLLSDVAAARDDAAVSHLNAGTFNFAPGSNAEFHTLLDIAPWVLWGNSSVDATRWTPQQRLAELTAATPQKAASIFNDLLEWTEANVGNVPFYESIIRVRGTANDDVLIGTEGNERFRGSAGTDTVDYSNGSLAVTASLARREGYDGDARGDEYYGIENLIGTQFGDILIGDNGDNLLYGDLGSDILSGGHGNDTLDGGSGRNTLRGGTGDDHLLIFNETTEARGGRGEDTLVSAVDRLYIGGHDRFSSLEVFKLTDDPFFALRAHTLIGSDRNETLIGNAYGNTLYGGDGKDSLTGLAGNDALQGGDGDDDYYFGAEWGTDYVRDDSGTDKLIFQSHELKDLRFVHLINGNDLLIYGAGQDEHVIVQNHFSHLDNFEFESLKTSDGTLDLTGGLPFTGTDANEGLQGTEYDDRVDASGGRDFIYAGAGKDSLIGGDGNDFLYGGDDDDTYVFRPGFGNDQIFESGVYQTGVDSAGDTIAFMGISPVSVSRTDSLGNTTLTIAGSDDSIFIRSQNWNNGDGPLIEWVTFDGGLAIPVSQIPELA